MFGFFSLAFIPFFLFIFAINIIGFVLWVWMLIDCATNETDKENQKLIWILIIIFANWIGAAIYYFVRRPQRIKELKK